jgi:O-antigen ligase
MGHQRVRRIARRILVAVAARGRGQAWTGSGVGTFEQVYRGYENPATVDRWFVNHAHNDYLEVAVEGGVPAVILVVLFLLWWIGRARAAWSTPSALELKGASIASAAILLHSAFDYPLRTAGIAALFAACLALLAGARGASGAFAEGEQARHARL